MKEHAKKALKHDFEVAGKTIPTLAIAALFLVGTGSAALLSSFGTVSGEADISQAIQVGGNNGEADLDYTFSNVVGGDTVVNTYEVTNNMDQAYELSYSSGLTVLDGGLNDSYVSNNGNVVEWADSEGGITTTYGQKFVDAGHSFDYSAPSGNTISDPSNIDTSDTTYVLSESGATYGSFTIDQSNVVVAAESQGVKIDGTVTINADNVTLKGFEITGGSESPLNQGVHVTSTVEDVVIESNEVHDIRGSERATGIKFYGQKGTLTDVVATNNYVHDIKTTSLEDAGKEEKSKGIAISGDVQNAEVSYNTIKTVGDSESAMSNGVDINTGTDSDTVPENFVVTYNEISDIDHAEDHDHSSGNPYTYTAGGVYVTGYNTAGNSFGSDHKISYNNFQLSETEATTDVKTYDNGEAGTLNAEDNYWGKDGIQYEVSDTVYTEDSANGEVDVSWDNTVDAGETATIAAINQFPLYIDGSYEYHLKTTIR